MTTIKELAKLISKSAGVRPPYEECINIPSDSLPEYEDYDDQVEKFIEKYDSDMISTMDIYSRIDEGNGYYSECLRCLTRMRLEYLRQLKEFCKLDKDKQYRFQCITSRLHTKYDYWCYSDDSEYDKSI